MRRSGLEIKVGSLLAAVAIIAVDLATPVESARVAMIGTITTCIADLAYNGYSEAVSLRQTSGLRTGPAQKVGVLLSSVTVALVVVGFSRGKSLPELALQLGDDTGTEAENRTDTQT